MPVIIGSGLIAFAAGLVFIVLCYRDLSRANSRLQFLKSPGTPQAAYSAFAGKLRILWPIAVLIAIAGILTLILA